MKTYKFKLYNSKRLKHLNETISLSCRAYNYSIALSKRYYRLFGKSLNYQKLQKHMTFKKQLFNVHLDSCLAQVDAGRMDFNEFDAIINRLYWKCGFLEDIPSQALQQVTERMKNSYKLFFESRKRRLKASPPGFKSSRKYLSFTLKQAGWRYDESGELRDNKIKIGEHNFKFHKSRSVDGEIKTITIKRNLLGEMFICFACQEKLQVMTGINPTTGKMARAIDFGLRDFLVFDNGEKIKSPEFLKRSIKKLRILSRAFSKKMKGSNNRETSRKKLVKLHAKVANQRLEWSRAMAHAICRSFQGKAGYIFIEDLNLRGMKVLWGRKVSDIAYGLMVRELSWIAKSYQIELVKLGRFERSTGVCSETGLVRKLNLAERSWNCECGSIHDRDIESARTILKAGLGLVRDSAVSLGYAKQAS